MSIAIGLSEKHLVSESRNQFEAKDGVEQWF